MGPRFTLSVAEVLRRTLRRIEESPEFRRDDPAIIELKKHIIHSIAELEVARSAHSDAKEGDESRPTREEARPDDGSS
jgi:hypothetical protein